MGAQEEIDEMLHTLETRHVEEEVHTDAKEELKEEEGSEEEHKEELGEEREEKQVETAVKPEEKEEKEIPPLTEDKDKIIDSLRKQLEDRSDGRLVDKGEKIEVKEEEVKQPTLEDQDFIGDLDPEDIVRDKDEFNKLLNTVYKRGVTDASKHTSDRVFSTLPSAVKDNVILLSTLKEASDKFYADNKDLAPFRKVVATVFEEVASQNSNKRYDELMNLVAPEVRRRLELPAKSVEKQSERQIENPPKLHGKKGGPRSAPNSNPSPLQDELEAMNNSLGR